MCGIFGFVANSYSGLDATSSRRLLIELFHMSEPRGKDASGLVLVSGGTAATYKKPLPPDRFRSAHKLKKLLSNMVSLCCDEQTGVLTKPFAAIGHCRLVTSGLGVIHENNQPIVVQPIVGIHNGLVTNEKDLWQKYSSLTPSYDVDSEIIFQLINKYYEEGYSISRATSKCFSEIEGTASIAFFRQGNNQLVLATNCGSLYFIQGKGITIFASERRTLELIPKANKVLKATCNNVEWLKADTGRLISLDDATCEKIDLTSLTPIKNAEDCGVEG